MFFVLLPTGHHVKAQTGLRTPVGELDISQLKKNLMSMKDGFDSNGPHRNSGDNPRWVVPSYSELNVRQTSGTNTIHDGEKAGGAAYPSDYAPES